MSQRGKKVHSSGWIASLCRRLRRKKSALIKIQFHSLCYRLKKSAVIKIHFLEKNSSIKIHFHSLCHRLEKKFIDQNTLTQSLSETGKMSLINIHFCIVCHRLKKKCIDQEILLQSLSQTRITDQDSELISKFTTRLNSLSTVLSNSNPRGRLLCMIRTQPSSTNSPQDWTA